VAKVRTRPIQDFLASHPAVDHVAALGAVLAWSAIFGATDVPEDARVQFLIGVATVSGLVLAAATFVAALTYQSANILMSRVRERYSTLLKRNWTSIIVSTMATAAAPVVAILFSKDHNFAALAVGIYSLALLATRFGRSVFWLRYTLFMQDTVDAAPGTYRLDPPRRRTSPL